MNFSFQFLCSTCTQIKMYQGSVFFGHCFGTVYCRITSVSAGFASWTPTRALPLTRWGAGPTVPPNSHLLEAITYGHCISCLRHGNTFIHAPTTNLAHYSKFLKRRPGIYSGLSSLHPFNRRIGRTSFIEA